MDLSRAGWRKSSYSNAGNNNCVEVGPADRVVGVRDTKDRARGALAVQPGAWSALIDGVKREQLTR